MTADLANKLVQDIYDSIFDSVTKSESGGKPLLPASSTVLTLMKPGLAINSKDFKNPWTPGNMNGSKDAAINTAQLIDVAPKVNALYTDSGIKISEVYGQIVRNASIPAQKPDPAIEKQLKDAHAILYRIIDVTDPDTGQVTQVTAESQLYRDYLDNQAAYFNARQAYVAAYLEAQKNHNGTKYMAISCAYISNSR